MKQAIQTKQAGADLCFSAMAGIFPGAASVDELWQRILHAEVAPLCDMPARWGIAREAIYAEQAGQPNRIYFDQGYCLPEQAEPGCRFPWGHQLASTRQVLQQLVRQASADGARFEASETALVMGTSWSDESYFLADALAHEPPASGSPADSPVSGSMAGGPALRPGLDPDQQARQLADALGLGGPVLAVDTACSSFAYALELATGLLRSGQARKVIVAGVNAFLPPSLYLGFSQIRALAADGRLRALGQEAAGIALGECVAAFLLEAQLDAEQEGRQPLAALRGLGLSSDGAEGSVFAPGKQAQMAAYARAWHGLDPGSVDYVEAHGTGTPVGDGTELDSLDQFFRAHREDGPRVPVGSVKALIGHTLAAAGAAALVKALLMLRHRTLPPHIAVTPHARLQDSCLELPQQATPFPARERALRIGISSFGFGGANAHIVVEEARPLPPCVAPANSGRDTSPAGATFAPAAAALSGITLPARGAAIQLDLAVIDLDAAFGDAPSAAAWQEQLARADRTQAPFPRRWQGSHNGQAGNPAHGGLTGRFLRGEINIDIAGYRMGPRPLAHVDPFKMLVTHRANTMLRRQPELIGSMDTAFVMCANMGGERFFDAYRKIRRYYSAGHHAGPAGSIQDGGAHDAPGGGAAPVNIVVDDVPTMLPTMLSGYPAQILNLRAFHQTLSGSAGIFWQALLTSPVWLQQRCRTLVLGAGRYLGSRFDLAQAQACGGVHGEGVGMLALQTALEAEARDSRVLAVIRSVVYAFDAANLEQARELAAIGESSRQGGGQSDGNAAWQDSKLEICELAAGASYQGGQACSGYLAEACGIESMLAVLMQGAAKNVIEVRRHGKPLFWLFVEQQQPFVASAEAAPRLPFALNFSTAEQAANANGSGQIAAGINAGIPAGVLIPASPATVPPFPARDQPAGAPVMFADAARPAAPASRVSLPAVDAAVQALSTELADWATVDDGSIASAAFAQLTQTMLTSLRLRSRALDMLHRHGGWQAPAQERDLSAMLRRLRRDVGNLVLKQPSLAEGGLQASMVIDETHPYFFDHPLDHVPGILLLEGALQLTELALALRGERALFINSISVRFRRYTEKQVPITVLLQAGAHPNEFRVNLTQGGNAVCECVLGAGPMPANSQAAAAGAALPQGHPEMRQLHKAKQENVLVSGLEAHAGGWRVHTVPVAAGHLFDDGDAQHFSLLYFLETARQCLMLVAHTRLGIPTGVPMNLVELRFALAAPIPRHQPLHIVPEFRDEAWQGLVQTGRVGMTLHSLAGPIGNASIVSQVVDKELYALQRHGSDA